MTENSSQKTGQTVQDEKHEDGRGHNKRPYFEVSSDDEGNWHWVMWSSNGVMMAMNPRPFNRRNDCTAAIKSVMRSAGVASKIVIAQEL